MIRLVINYRFVQRIATQMNALKQGFQDILPLETLKVFDEKEVEVWKSIPSLSSLISSLFSFSSVVSEKSMSMIGEPIPCTKVATHRIILLSRISGRYSSD